MTDASLSMAAAPTAAAAHRWHRRAIERADVAGGLVVLIPVMLGAYFVTGARPLEYAMYGLCVLAALPQVGPFLVSLRRSPASLLLVLLFGVLAVATAAAFASDQSGDAWLRAKALAATAAWASIYVVVSASATSVRSVARCAAWIETACVVLSASVYASALAYALGGRFGEILEVDGGVRAFGPIGDQVGFVIVLAALTSLAASRPLLVGIHVGAVLLTGTRGAALCLAVGAAAYVLMVAARTTGRRRAFAGAIASVLVVLAVWASPLSSAFVNRVGEGAEEGTLRFRLLAIESATAVFLEHPYLGVGFSGVGSARQAVAEDWLNPDVTGNALAYATNQYVQTAADGGVPALLVLALFVFCCARNALRNARWRYATPALIGSQLWLVAMFAGNQASQWILADAASGFFLFAVAGLAAGTTATAQRT